MFSLFRNPEKASATEAFTANADMLLQLVVGCFSAEYHRQLSLVKFLDFNNLIIVDEKFELDIVVGKYQLRHNSTKSLRLKTFFKPEKLKNDDDNVLKIAEMFNITLPVGFTKGYGSLSMMFYYQFIDINVDYMIKKSVEPEGAYEFVEPMRNKASDYFATEYGEKAFDLMGFVREAPKLSDVEGTIDKLNDALKSFERKNADGTMLEDFYKVQKFERNDTRDGIDTANGTFYVLTETSGGYAFGIGSTTSIKNDSYYKALYYIRAAYQYEFDGQLPSNNVTDFKKWLLNPTFKMVTAEEYEKRFNVALNAKNFEDATTEALDFSKQKFGSKLVDSLKTAEIAFARDATKLDDMQRMIDVSKRLGDAKHTQELQDILKNTQEALNLLEGTLPENSASILGVLGKLKNASKLANASYEDAKKRAEEAAKVPKASEPPVVPKASEPPSSEVPESPEAPEASETPEPEVSEAPEPSEADESSASVDENVVTLDSIAADKTMKKGHVVKLFNAYLKRLKNAGYNEGLPKKIAAQKNAKEATDRPLKDGTYRLATTNNYKDVTAESKKTLINALRKFSLPSSGVPETVEPPSSGVPETVEPQNSGVPEASKPASFEPFSDVKIDNLQQKMDEINKTAQLDNSAVSQARLQAAAVFKDKKDRKALVFSQLKL